MDNELLVYRQKYLKYKQKYAQLMWEQSGGGEGISHVGQQIGGGSDNLFTVYKEKSGFTVLYVRRGGSDNMEIVRSINEITTVSCSPTGDVCVGITRGSLGIIDLSNEVTNSWKDDNTDTGFRSKFKVTAVHLPSYRTEIPIFLSTASCCLLGNPCLSDESQCIQFAVGETSHSNEVVQHRLLFVNSDGKEVENVTTKMEARVNYVASLEKTVVFGLEDGTVGVIDPCTAKILSTISVGSPVKVIFVFEKKLYVGTATGDIVMIKYAAELLEIDSSNHTHNEPVTFNGNIVIRDNTKSMLKIILCKSPSTEQVTFITSSQPNVIIVGFETQVLWFDTTMYLTKLHDKYHLADKESIIIGGGVHGGKVYITPAPRGGHEYSIKPNIN